MSRWNIRTALIPALLIMLTTGTIQPARAQTTLTELEPFSFGLFALRNNNPPRNLSVVAGTNMVSADPEFVVDIDPQRGEYRLDGFDPGTEVNVTIDDGGLTLSGMGGTEVFATVNYTISPSPLIADGSGIILFNVGATLRTIGNGTNYDSGTYSDDLDITFDWVP